MRSFAQFKQRVDGYFKQRLVPFFNGVYGKLRKLVSGNPIVIADASNEPLETLRVFGKSTQDGTPTPDAPVEVVGVENPTINVDSQTLSVPYTLHGIPVTSSGNYTDENGQQWICDEIDFKRGVYVQRVYNKTFDGTEHIFKYESTPTGHYFSYKDASVHHNKTTKHNTGYLCNMLTETTTDILWKQNTDGFTIETSSDDVFRFRLSSVSDVVSVESCKAKLADWYAKGTPMVLVALLSTPIETSLTADQIEAYKALHTNKPNTTIYNDQNAWMEVVYITE